MYIEKMTTLAGDFLVDKPFGKEIFLEGFLVQSIEHITPPGLTATGVVVNQVSINGGRIDIAFELANNDGWVLAELKVGRLEKNHLNQLIGYLCKLKELSIAVIERIQSEQKAGYFADFSEEELKSINANINACSWIGILVGEDIDPDLAYDLIKENWRTDTQYKKCQDDCLSNIDIGAVVIKRVTDNGQLNSGLHKNTFVFADKYFPIAKRSNTNSSSKSSTTQRDYSKFSFDGKKTWFGVGRFVEAVVNDYANTLGTVSLPTAFPSSLQGSLGVVASNPTDMSRYFANPVAASGFYVCSQWGYAHGKGNLARFVEHIKNQHNYVVWRKEPDGTITQI